MGECWFLVSGEFALSVANLGFDPVPLSPLVRVTLSGTRITRADSLPRSRELPSHLISRTLVSQP